MVFNALRFVPTDSTPASTFSAPVIALCKPADNVSSGAVSTLPLLLIALEMVDIPEDTSPSPAAALLRFVASVSSADALDESSVAALDREEVSALTSAFSVISLNFKSAVSSLIFPVDEKLPSDGKLSSAFFNALFVSSEISGTLNAALIAVLALLTADFPSSAALLLLSIFSFALCTASFSLPDAVFIFSLLSSTALLIAVAVSVSFVAPFSNVVAAPLTVDLAASASDFADLALPAA